MRKSVLFEVLFLDMGLYLLVSAESPELLRGLNGHLDQLHDAHTQPQAQGSSQLWRGFKEM